MDHTRAGVSAASFVLCVQIRRDRTSYNVLGVELALDLLSIFLMDLGFDEDTFYVKICGLAHASGRRFQAKTFEGFRLPYPPWVLGVNKTQTLGHTGATSGRDLDRTTVPSEPRRP